jgi:hypothetical protein
MRVYWLGFDDAGQAEEKTRGKEAQKKSEQTTYMTCCSVTTLTFLCGSLAFFLVLGGIVNECGFSGDK